MRIFIAASGILTLAVIERFMSHVPFVAGLILGLGVFGSMLLWSYMEDAERRRRTSAQQQPSNVEERDASGG